MVYESNEKLLSEAKIESQKPWNDHIFGASTF